MILWIKKNWFNVLLVVIIIALVKSRSSGLSDLGIQTSSKLTTGFSLPPISSDSYGGTSGFYNDRQIPPSDSSNRLVVQNTSLSLQVNDVPEVISNIETTAKNLGGFLVDSNLSKPEDTSSGHISVRVPENKRSEALQEFKKMAAKVVSESVNGYDVTDQYQDIDSQLIILAKTKQKYEEILDKAITVNDLLNVQRELINLQSQIDSFKGQQKYLEQSAKLTKITIYLSTDDLALPYAPGNEWRPAVIFKEAVRSLIQNFRRLGNLLIWGIVYLPLLIPVLFLYKRWKKS